MALLQARRDALAAKHHELLRELAELRASEALTLAQAEDEARANYLSTNRAALLAERERLTRELARRQEPAAA